MPEKKLILTKSHRDFFMDPALALADGVVGVSEEIVPELLFEAYNYGIFPWPHEENEPILWFCPPRRGVLDFAELHIPKSLLKSRRRCSWAFTVNQDFDQVIKACSQSFRPEQAGTWITEAMMGAFREFHRQGYAHSIECWEQGKLIGGLYGTYVAGVFSPEPHFFFTFFRYQIKTMMLIEGLLGDSDTLRSTSFHLKNQRLRLSFRFFQAL